MMRFVIPVIVGILLATFIPAIPNTIKGFMP